MKINFILATVRQVEFELSVYRYDCKQTAACARRLLKFCNANFVTSF